MKSGLARATILAGLAAGSASAQQGAATLQFSLDRNGPPLTQYTLTVNADGEGTYTPQLQPSGAGITQGANGGADLRQIHIVPALTKKLFAAVPMVEGGHCETHNKSIAQTGTKVLRYQGPERTAECTFNYSDDERVNEAAATFEALSETMRFGDRLRSKLRFDRLGLDGELEQLVTAVGEKRALEVGNIAPVLQAIQDDERVMERARRKATHLLAGAQAAQTAAGVPSSDR